MKRALDAPPFPRCAGCEHLSRPFAERPCVGCTRDTRKKKLRWNGGLPTIRCPACHRALEMFETIEMHGRIQPKKLSMPLSGWSITIHCEHCGMTIQAYTSTALDALMKWFGVEDWT